MGLKWGSEPSVFYTDLFSIFLKQRERHDLTCPLPDAIKCYPQPVLKSLNYQMNFHILIISNIIMIVD